MYAGLTLVPWVILYGVTAVMFNHGSWFTPTRALEVSASDLASGPTAALPSAAEIAAEVIAQLERAGGDAPLELSLVDESARWVGSFSTSARTETDRLRISFDPLGRGGKVSATPVAPEDAEAEDLFTREELDALDLSFAPTEEDVDEQFRRLAALHDLEVTELSRRRWPSVEFDVERGGELYSCDVGMDGEVEFGPSRGPSTVRRKLLRLHVQHGDSGYGGWRRVWALVVDIKGISMIGWGLTGVVMWWSIKKTRRIGAWSMAAGFVTMAILAVAVWRVTGMS